MSRHAYLKGLDHPQIAYLSYIAVYPDYTRAAYSITRPLGYAYQNEIGKACAIVRIVAMCTNEKKHAQSRELTTNEVYAIKNSTQSLRRTSTHGNPLGTQSLSLSVVPVPWSHVPYSYHGRQTESRVGLMKVSRPASVLSLTSIVVAAAAAVGAVDKGLDQLG